MIANRAYALNSRQPEHPLDGRHASVAKPKTRRCLGCPWVSNPDSRLSTAERLVIPASMQLHRNLGRHTTPIHGHADAVGVLQAFKDLLAAGD